MGSFAKVENGIVVNVISCDENEAGQQFLQRLGGTWIQTSYNTHAGQHRLGGTPLRKNYAGIGYTYDTERDAFIPPKRYPSWVLNEETCCYTPPVAYPVEGGPYHWDEEAQQWIV